MIATLAIKPELKAQQVKTVNLQAFDSSYFQGKNHFQDDGTENYLVFQLIYRFLKKLITDHISVQSSKGLSNESIKPPATSDNSLAPPLNHIGFRTRIKFDCQSLR